MPAVNSGRRVSDLPAAILERVHLLGDDVGALAERAGEDLGRLEDRHLDMLEGIEPAHAIERVHDLVEAFGLDADHVLGTPDLLRTLRHRAGHLGSFARRWKSDA